MYTVPDAAAPPLLTAPPRDGPGCPWDQRRAGGAKRNRPGETPARRRTAPPTLDTHDPGRALRRRAEVSFWAVVLLVQATFNTVVTRIELRSAGRTVAAWEPLLWELTSALGGGALIPAVVALRRAGYAARGERYQPPSWWAQWGYEYLKDVRSYTLAVCALVSYRFLLLRLQGEARVLDAPEPPAPQVQDVPETPAAQAPASTPETPHAPPAQR